MAIQVIGAKKHRVMRPFLIIFAYILVMSVSSAQGWCPMISFMKLFLFSLIYFAYFGVSNKVGIDAKVSTKRIRSIMLVFASYFVLGSIALLPFPGLSQLDARTILEMGGSLEDLKERVSLFMGMTTHSQSLGPIISMIAVILLSDLLFSIKKFDPLYVVLLLCCPILIYKTSSRTGMGSFLLGQLFVIFLFANVRGVKGRWKSRVMSWAMLFGVLLLVVTACSPGVQKGIRQFTMKFGDAGAQDVTMENVMMTRQAKITETWENFKKSPLLGNGFQVSEAMEGMKVNGLVLSAPIEKGVWITAVLEEGGIIGFTVFVAFLSICFFASIKRRAYMTASCLFVMTLANLGEFSFFSMSYTGGFEWAMVFVALALDIRRLSDENAIWHQRMMQQQQMAFAMMGGPR